MDLIELAQEIGLQTKRTSSTNGGEYASSCPDCGGRDRFRIWPNQQAKNCTGTYWCRQCDKKGDAIQFCVDFLGLSFQDACNKMGAEVKRHSHSRSVERSFNPPSLMCPKEKWSQRAFDCILWASDTIARFPIALRSLEERGLSSEAITKYRIGYCDRDLWTHPSEFGIDSEKKIWLPEGVVIPTMEPSGKIIRLKIRRTKWNPSDEFPKYWAVKGSMNGLNIVGDVRKPVMAVLESELDALALHSACSDLLFTVAVGSNTKNPDNVVDYWAKRRRLLIIHDNDPGGLSMNEKWQRIYSHAESWPVPIEQGKDIGEAVARGFRMREWLCEVIEKNLKN